MPFRYGLFRSSKSGQLCPIGIICLEKKESIASNILLALAFCIDFSRVVSYKIMYHIARLSKKIRNYNHAAIIRIVFIFIFMGQSLFFSSSLG